MPHLTLEYSDNVEFEVQALLARLHNELAATGVVNLKGLKSRAIQHTEYRIADGYPDYAFVHLNILLRAGRTVETQQVVAKRAMTVLEETFGHCFNQGYLSLSIDIKEMAAGVALTHHNIPEGGVKP